MKKFQILKEDGHSSFELKLQDKINEGWEIIEIAIEDGFYWAALVKEQSARQ